MQQYIPEMNKIQEDCAEFFQYASSMEVENDFVPTHAEDVSTVPIVDESESDSDSDSDTAESIEVIMTVEKTKVMGHGYSFVTSKISNLDVEINRLNAGKLIVYKTYNISRTKSRPLYIVKVWLDGWTNGAMEKQLLAGKEVRINVSVSPPSYWKAKYLTESLP